MACEIVLSSSVSRALSCLLCTLKVSSSKQLSPQRGRLKGREIPESLCSLIWRYDVCFSSSWALNPIKEGSTSSSWQACVGAGRPEINKESTAQHGKRGKKKMGSCVSVPPPSRAVSHLKGQQPVCSCKVSNVLWARRGKKSGRGEEAQLLFLNPASSVSEPTWALFSNNQESEMTQGGEKNNLGTSRGSSR